MLKTTHLNSCLILSYEDLNMLVKIKSSFCKDRIYYLSVQLLDKKSVDNFFTFYKNLKLKDYFIKYDNSSFLIFDSELDYFKEKQIELQIELQKELLEAQIEKKENKTKAFKI